MQAFSLPSNICLRIQAKDARIRSSRCSSYVREFIAQHGSCPSLWSDAPGVAPRIKGCGKARRCLYYVEEPVSTDALLPTASVFRAVAGAKVTTVLSGEGSDELFAGYKKVF
jgi:hypothetical protein